MSHVRPRKARAIRPLLTACLAASLALALALGACGWWGDTTTGKPSAIQLCAVDPLQGVCVSGDYQGVNASQIIRGVATDPGGKTLGGAKVKMTVSGANGATQTVTTLSNGTFTFSYNGAHAGDDQITAALDGAPSTTSRVVVRWLNPTHTVRPILFVHGTNENAVDFTTQMHADFHDPNPAPNSSARTFTSLFEALTLKYDPHYLEAMCYVDDRAYNYGVSSSGCRFPPDRGAYPTACAPGSTPLCESQSAVDDNALMLWHTVEALSAEAVAAGAKTPKVTLIGYSMGGAVIRSFLAGCPMPVAPYGAQRCPNVASNLIDQVFYVDPDQQGSWLLNINKGLNAATLSGDGSIPKPINPFSSVLPLVQQAIYGQLKSRMGLDGFSPTVTDQTPQSDSILAHDQYLPPSGIPYYNFFGDVQIRLGLSAYGLPLDPGAPTLNLGDLVMLAQDDRATFAPAWGGAGLCEGCTQPLDKYRKSPSGQYHNWILIDSHGVDMSIVADLLTGTTSVSSEAGKVLNSPVQHLNITQPTVQAPGSTWQVQDITSHAATTDMSTEIFYILTKFDSVTLP
jgi:pimeloyl-ACP methyl ester carboxylesterase